MEIDIMKKIQVSLSSAGARVFRNNIGLGWIGKTEHYKHRTTVMVCPGDVVIRNARPLHAGLEEGSADLVGWDSQTGKIVSCEVKQPGKKQTIKQINWMEAILQSGGIAFCASSVEDAIKRFEDLNGKQNKFRRTG